MASRKARRNPSTTTRTLEGSFDEVLDRAVRDVTAHWRLRWSQEHIRAVEESLRPPVLIDTSMLSTIWEAHWNDLGRRHRRRRRPEFMGIDRRRLEFRPGAWKPRHVEHPLDFYERLAELRSREMIR